MSFTARETDSRVFSSESEQWTADDLPRELAMGDTTDLALGSLTFIDVPPPQMRIRVQHGQQAIQFFNKLLNSKGLSSANKENIVTLLGRLGTASFELADSRDIDEVLQRANVTLTMPALKAELAKWHRLGHLQGAAEGFAKVMARPETIATMRDTSALLLKQAKLEAEEQEKKAKLEAEEQEKKAKLEAEEQEKTIEIFDFISGAVNVETSVGVRGVPPSPMFHKLAWNSKISDQLEESLQGPLGSENRAFLGTTQRKACANNVIHGVGRLAVAPSLSASTSAKLLVGPRGSGKSFLVWTSAVAAIRALPSDRGFDLVALKIDAATILGSDERQVGQLREFQAFAKTRRVKPFVPSPLAIAQYALWKQGLLRDSQVCRRMAAEPWSRSSWHNSFTALLADLNAKAQREIRLVLFIDEFQCFYHTKETTIAFIREIRPVVYALPEVVTWLAGSPSVCTSLLFNPAALKREPFLAEYPGLELTEASWNSSKLVPSRLDRLTGEDAVRFVVECLRPNKSELEHSVNAKLWQLYDALPPESSLGSASERKAAVTKLRELPAWQEAAEALDLVRPTPRQLATLNFSTDLKADILQQELTSFNTCMLDKYARLIVSGLAMLPFDHRSGLDVKAAASASLLLGTRLYEGLDLESITDDLHASANALLDRGIIQHAQPAGAEFRMCAPHLHALAMATLAGEHGKMTASQRVALVDPRGGFGEALELLAAQGITSMGVGPFLEHCLNTYPDLPSACSGPADAMGLGSSSDSTNPSSIVNLLIKASIRLEALPAGAAAPPSPTEGETDSQSSALADALRVDLLPKVRAGASAKEVVPMNTFFKEQPDWAGADMTVVFDVELPQGGLLRNCLRVQQKGAKDSRSIPAFARGEPASILAKMNQPFRCPEASKDAQDLSGLFAGASLDNVAGVVVWNCLSTCKVAGIATNQAKLLKALKTASKGMWEPPSPAEVERALVEMRVGQLSDTLATDVTHGYHPFKTERCGLPVWVLPIVADHSVMLEVWPEDVRRFALAGRLQAYAGLATAS